MATITAVVAGGNWSATTTWSTGTVPTATDDVVLGSSSGNVTIDVASVCQSLTCTGYTGTLTHNAFTLTIGSATAPASGAALTLVTGMTYTLANNATSALAFVSTATSVQTIAWGGKTTGNVTFNGLGSSYSFSSAHTANISSATVTLLQGTLNLNGQTCNWGSFNANGTLARTLTMGAAVVNVNQVSNVCWNLQTVTNLTVNAGTSTLTLIGGNNNSYLSTYTWYSIVMTLSTGGHQINGVFTCTNFTVNGNSTTGNNLLTIANNFTVTGTFTCAPTATGARFAVRTAQNFGVPVTITAAAVSLAGVDFRDITAAGAAIPWTGTNLGNSLGNTNITFAAGVTRYWVATSGGTWDLTTTSNWAATSGGTSGASVPLPQDNVVFDANSITSTGKTITINNTRICANMTFNGVLNNPTVSYSVGNSTIEIAGNLDMTGTTVSGTTTVEFHGRGTQTITTGGATVTYPITVQAYIGTYTQQDNFVSNTTFTMGSGTWASGNFGLTCTRLTTTSSSTKQMNMGTSTITLTYTGNNTILDFNAGGMVNSGLSTCTIVISTTATVTRTFNGAGLTYGTLTYTVAGSSGTLLIAQNNTFANINFSDATTARTLQLGSNSVQIITGSFNVNGTSGILMTINASTGGVKATLQKASGVVNINYVSIQDNLGTGGAAFYAGPNSTLVSQVIGWANYAQPVGFGNLFQVAG